MIKRFLDRFKPGRSVFPVFLFGLGIVLFFLITDTDLPDAVKFDAFEKLIYSTKPGCVYEDSFDIYHYESVPEDKRENNKFGLYVYAESEKYIKLADTLVNSNGGDWGYVLVPYNVYDRDYDKWNRAFSLFNKKHLIPVIQLWDVEPTNYASVTEEAAVFLNRFLWPIKQRYISVYNEPNDQKFWKGTIDPSGYAEVLDYTIDVFKAENENFFVLNGAFNASAPTSNGYMDEEAFMYQMNESVPGIFEKLDGWASHSYPQPNFSGSPDATGRWSIRAYESELSFLQNDLGVKKNLPVFITETGWAHAEGKSYSSEYLPVETVAEYFEKAYKEVWLEDDRVVAVMPFTIWYDSPYDHFSWVDWRDVPYAHFQAVKSMKKVAGNPDKLVLDQEAIISCEEK